jgi:hypothetical protein
MVTRFVNDSISRMNLGGFMRPPTAGTTSHLSLASNRNGLFGRANSVSAQAFPVADRGMAALDAIRNRSTSTVSNGFLPGGCDILSSPRPYCGLPMGSELGAMIKQAVDLISNLLNRLKGNNLGSSINSPGSFDPRDRSPLTPPYGGGTGRPGGPVIAPPNLGVDRGGRGGGGDRPDCDLPKR